MMNLTPSLPPVTLTDDALRLAAALLQLCADPAGTKAWLDELNTATTTLRSAIDAHAQMKTQAETATAALADVERRAKELAAREDALIASQTRLNVASGALARRDEALRSKEGSARLILQSVLLNWIAASRATVLRLRADRFCVTSASPAPANLAVCKTALVAADVAFIAAYNSAADDCRHYPNRRRASECCVTSAAA